MPTPRRYENHAARQAAYRKRQADARNKELGLPAIPPLPAIATLPGWPRCRAITQRLLLLLDTMRSEMQDYYGQRSEDWQEGERGEAMTERLQAIEEAISGVEALEP